MVTNYISDKAKIGENTKIWHFVYIIGSKAVIKAGVTVGKNSIVAMGAVVINDVPPDTVVAGIPAKPKYSRDEYNKKQSEWKNI